MKLSVCIPVYNFDVRNLVEDLNREINKKELDAEIILIDDASDETFTNINKDLLDKVQSFIFLDKNVGRSKIRNLFLNYSKGEYMLFLDCDVKIDNTNFLSNYLQQIEQNRELDLFYGSFKISPQYSHTLRNKYSLEREIPIKGKSDFSTFKTVNFVVKKDVFRRFTFNEELANYGYEDYIFAKKLEINNIKFLAINNPVIHVDDSRNDVFLAKTETAINSLFQVSQKKENHIFIKDMKVYRIAQKIKKAGFISLFLFFYSFVESKMVNNLLSDNPKIMYLDFYKLGLLLKKMN